MVHGKNEFVTMRDGPEFFVEAYTTPPQMVLCGGGHVSKAIAPLAATLGFRVFVTDDREEFANSDRFPEADIIVAEKPESALPQLPINPNTFIIIATRGHRYDNVALEAAALTPAKYVGLLGSKRKTILIYEDLIRTGLPIERIREIRSPVGLDVRGPHPRGDRGQHHGRGAHVPARRHRPAHEDRGLAHRPHPRKGRGRPRRSSRRRLGLAVLVGVRGSRGGGLQPLPPEETIIIRRRTRQSAGRKAKACGPGPRFSYHRVKGCGHRSE